MNIDYDITDVLNDEIMLDEDFDSGINSPEHCLLFPASYFVVGGFPSIPFCFIKARSEVSRPLLLSQSSPFSK